MALIRARTIDSILRKGGRLLGDIFFAGQTKVVLSPLEKQYLAAIVRLNSAREISSPLTKAWDENKHPRDKRGRFASRAETRTPDEAVDVSRAAIDKPPSSHHEIDYDDPVVQEITRDEGSDRYTVPEVEWDEKLDHKLDEGTATLHDYVDAIRNTLQDWEAVHTNPDAWARNEFPEDVYDDGGEMFERMVREIKNMGDSERNVGGVHGFNMFAGFDGEEELARALARAMKWAYTYYEGFGILEDGENAQDRFESQIEEKNDELRDEWENTDEDERPDEPPTFDIEDVETRSPTDDELTQYYLDNGEVETFAPGNLNYDDLIEIVKKAFPYRQQMVDSYFPLKDRIIEVHQHLEAIKNAPDNIELLQAATWAAHQEHATTGTGEGHKIGNIIETYGHEYGIPGSLFNRIQEAGLVEVFGQEAVDEFMGMPTRVNKSLLRTSISRAVK